MKRTLIAVVAAAGLGVFAGRAPADPGGYAPPGGAAAMSPAPVGAPGTLFGPGPVSDQAPDRYGWNPILRKLFRHNKGGCGPVGPGDGKNPLQNPANWAAGGYGQNGPAYNPQGFPPGAYGPNGPMMQGTLVFPHHTFVRSPRDYFMLDLNK